jgi:hypothetical protein
MQHWQDERVLPWGKRTDGIDMPLTDFSIRSVDERGRETENNLQ